ncbi:hypothetical protein [Calothrix sp. PCC 7507]|uniref:hypothetical protein n=1 Tax=Calothrix sp. PCC 7507 TaxID=99598 RepID=UPI00029ED8BE|nr:hypothetical protein [Calothrix sp. PCC 7507]AFY33391.1 hypothetical protein Cal7507_2977 [Calothrix sp. PCC 7507]
MNYQKLDAALAIALNDVPNPEESSLDVFIHTEPVLDADAAAVLENLGVSTATTGKDIFTAALSPNAISQLSEQPWVQYLKLSQQLSLVNRRLNPGKLGI